MSVFIPQTRHLQPVTQTVHFDYPPDLCFGCSKCGLCCGDTPNKTRHILLLKQDATRIAAATSKETATFATETPQNAPYIYEMHKNPADQKCVFLQNNQCTIYEHRPLICRFYPFELSTTENGVYVFRATDECPGVCATGQGVGKGKLEERFFRVLLELARVELNGGYL